MVRVGVVGHRNLGISAGARYVERVCRDILKQCLDTYDQVVALSALAEGADTLFAEAALALGIPLEVVRPFENYSSDFDPPGSKLRYERLRSAARQESVLPYRERSPEAYASAMTWILDRSNLLVAVWDGQAATGAGGTAHAAHCRVQDGRAWIHIDPRDP